MCDDLIDNNQKHIIWLLVKIKKKKSGWSSMYISMYKITACQSKI